MMSKILIQIVFLTVWLVHLDCEVYHNRPKIKTTDGDLILEPADGRNIYLRPNGAHSTIYVGDINILSVNISQAAQNNRPSAGAALDTLDVLALERRLDTLERNLKENNNLPPSDDISTNITTVSRSVSILQVQVRHLRTQVRTLLTDKCVNRPCINGGTCLSLTSDYRCLCPPNWEGANCGVDVNECWNFAGTELGCQNGATCINRPGSYECLCRTGWFGLHCTRKAKDCSGGDFEMCGHGTCVESATGAGIKCFCEQGWTNNGTDFACLTDIDECDSKYGVRCSANPRVECVNLPGSFRCGACPAGYEGDGYSCFDVDECAADNGGCSTSPRVACHNTVGSRVCGACPRGFVGDGVTCARQRSCAVRRGGCHPQATCSDDALASATLCLCPEGMQGDGVGPLGCYVPAASDNTTQHCARAPCLHGRCHVLARGYACVCERGYTGAHCDAALDPCARDPCRHGGRCLHDLSVARGYRCECTAQFSGDFCQQLRRRTCGGMLNAESGSIVYPLDAGAGGHFRPTPNATYEHNSRCAWVIHTSPDKVVNVTFTKFDIEYNPDCMYDFLQIHDGRTSANQAVGRFCGKVFPKGGNIISSHNYLYFWFRSDQSVAGQGFALHWTSITPVCGGRVDAASHGHVTSPGFPGRYPPGRDCYWQLTTSFGKRIQLYFFEFEIVGNNDCSLDYLAIYDGERSNDPLINKYCSSSTPAPVQSAGSVMLLHFHSNRSGKGFQIAYAPADGVPGCGGFYTADRGEITSPSFDGKYMNNLICDYKIKTTPGTKIRLNFKMFQLERSAKCKYDYLKIYDGSSADDKLVGRFCGTQNPITYTSTSNNIFIKFKSDRTTTSDGFRITYEKVCLQTVIGDSGIIKSPGYPFNYTHHTECEYVLGTAPGKAIQLTFQDFDVEDNNYYNCQYDKVEVRDGIDTNAILMGRYCGTEIPPIQTSTHNYMHVRFVSDMSVSGSGFYANFTTIDVQCGGIYRESIGLINHPAPNTKYGKHQNCTWLLISPPGYRIKLSWNRFDLEDTPSCSGDYLVIEDIDDHNEESVFPRFCGARTPPALTSFRNIIKITFKSDGSVEHTGFSLSYTFLDERSHCGGNYITSHGSISSPGWPMPYETNRDCTWIITVPPGQRLKLNITQFDLEKPIGGKCHLGDYLEIRNGATKSTPLIGQYCGTQTPQGIISTGNSLYLRFHSDFYLSGNGFKLTWDGTVRGCGGTLTGSAGSIASPNYPSNYNENAECFYKIVTSHGSRLKIIFTDLELERTVDCTDDYVEIFDGRDSSAQNLGRYCTMSAEINNIVTSTNYAFIKFRSDYMNAGKGFLLNYQTVCQNNLTASYGIIESPDFPAQYPSNLNCKWIINANMGNKINVTFSHFDVGANWQRFGEYPRISQERIRSLNANHPWIQSHGSCHGTYLRVREDSNGALVWEKCGSMIPAKITSHGSFLEIDFVSSQAFMRGTGFRLEYVIHGCGERILKRSGVLSFDRESVDPIQCDWILQTEVGTSVTISFNSIYMEKSHNCTTDAIEIYSGEVSQNSSLISRICDRSTLNIVHTSTNVVLVRFIKRSNLRDASFVGRFDTRILNCGGSIWSRYGTITSSNYPKNYEDNSDCTWNLHVPSNHRILLTIQELDLFSDGYNTCNDAIKVYDQNTYLTTNYSHIICADSHVNQVTSKSNHMVVRFVTDNEGNAKGFKANFTAICGSVINVKFDGILTNDDFISHSTINCTWTIVAPNPDQKISLTLTHMFLPRRNDILTNRHCPSSYFRVLDGDDKSAPLIGEFCGRKVPPMIVSQGSALTVEFGSYVGPLVGTFSAHYTAVDTACGGQLTSEEGSIASPNYPSSYPANINCEWKLKTSPGNRVYITFENFNLEESVNCNEDYLEVRENSAAGRLLGVYCGSNIPENTTVATELYIKFHSDNDASQPGFILNYGFLHGNDITGMNSGELASPLYPKSYVGAADYTWRISTTGRSPIVITVIRSEIMVHGQDCYNYLAIYDGYNDDAPILKKICGVWRSQSREIRASSNVVFLKLSLDESNTGSLFNIRWAKPDENILDTDIAVVNCGANVTQIILPGTKFDIKSPNYPEAYDNNLNCEWVFKASPQHQLYLKFEEIRLEETPNCFADYISVYSSKTGVGDWKFEFKTCLSNIERLPTIEELTFLKVTFVTDSSISRKGFLGHVTTKCGGLVTGSGGVISPSWADWKSIHADFNKMFCTWIVKVRPSHNIRAHFEHFNITRDTDNFSVGRCISYVTLRNGGAEEAPVILNKFCYDNTPPNGEYLTSGNYLYIKYAVSGIQSFKNFRLRYEEVNIECGFSSKLDSDNNWVVMSSPNYPSIPVPYTECVWVITGPPGEILRVDFIDRFDLESDADCKQEYVEIHDGLSEMSPVKGRYCSITPSSTKTSSNAVYIKYSTQIPDPRDGFKANVSIDICGGTIRASKGVLISPNYPHLTLLTPGTVCEWKIIGYSGLVFRIYDDEIDLPDTEVNCGTFVRIEESLSASEKVNLKTFCSNEGHRTGQVIESSTNEISVKLFIGKTREWPLTTSSRGFRLTFNSTRTMCGGRITTPEGIIETPGYPRKTTMRYCQWIINVPNKDRRVRLEVLDDDSRANHRIGIFNDFGYPFPAIANTSATNLFQSSGNKMVVYIWLNPDGTSHRFKARFSSNELSLCGGTLTGESGEITSPSVNQSYLCEWQYVRPQSNDGNEYNTLYLNTSITSSTARSRHCRYLDPKITIISESSSVTLTKYHELCMMEDVSLRIPYNIKIKAMNRYDTPLKFHISWKLQPCGGVVRIGENPVNVLNFPSNYSGPLDCIWNILVPSGNRIQLHLTGSFQADCDSEFISIDEGFRQHASTVLQKICKEKLINDDFSLHLSNIAIQYHALNSKSDIKLLVNTLNNECGGQITTYNRVFMSPNFPKSYKENQECTWEIKAALGQRISLQFIERFAIEQTANCYKDAVIVYDWKDDAYVQMARLCGRELPIALNSTENQMKVVLRTDDAVNLDGFRASWTPICGANLKATNKEQFLYSPGYPDDYPANMICEYTILAIGSAFVLEFIDFELEGTYPVCSSDNLTLHGTEAFVDDETDFAIFCGAGLPSKLKYVLEDRVRLVFKSDSYLQARGFKISYKLYNCGGVITEPQIISSSIGDKGYLDNMNCTWTIQAPENKIVVLKFLFIDIESSDDCDKDYLQVFDGHSVENNKRLGLLCGLINSTIVLRSSGSKMLLQFISDYSLYLDGFRVSVYFSYGASVGCGGTINLSTASPYNLKSPLIGNKTVYDDFLDCHWSIKAPTDYVIVLEFTKFHVAPCENINQTALGYSKCDCDLVEVRDGLNPNSIVIGTYCGHTSPPALLSSGNLLSVRLSTDSDDFPSGGFEALLRTRLSRCGRTHFTTSSSSFYIRSPGYEQGTMPRGEHCLYTIQTMDYVTVMLRVTVDLQEGSIKKDICDSDKLIISSTPSSHNVTAAKDFILSESQDNFFSSARYFIDTTNVPTRFEFCGNKQSINLYITSDVHIDFITSSIATDTLQHKGIEIEVSIAVGDCPKNYTEPQARIQTNNAYLGNTEKSRNCYTLISAPENYTISIYFMSLLTFPYITGDKSYLEIFDGNNTDALKLLRTSANTDDQDLTVFSSGRYLLLHNFAFEIEDFTTYDLNYVTTNKGRGCGGHLHNVLGQVTSPMYPDVFRKTSTCEWELETPSNTKIKIHFSEFDLGNACDQNYVQLIDREGNVISTFCDETPADYTSNDNYVKIFFKTDMNNSGQGWIVQFIAS